MKLILSILIIGVCFVLFSSMSFADSKDTQKSKKERVDCPNCD